MKHIGVDETSFQRRHEYVTIVTDLDSSRVLHVADDRKRESLEPPPDRCLAPFAERRMRSTPGWSESARGSGWEWRTGWRMGGGSRCRRARRRRHCRRAELRSGES
ncbi:MAG: transposase [Planctomycetes bacterium]|nr:transposase [Planctomycetota bacterium]